MKNKKFMNSAVAGVLAFVMIFGLVLNSLTGRVSAAPLSQLEEELAELEKNKEAMDAQLEELRGQLSDNLDELEAMVKQKNIIDQEVTLMNQQMRTINEQITAYSRLIAEKQEELTAAEDRLKELNQQNRDRIRAMEENGTLSYWSVLFQSHSFSDFLDRLKMVEQIQKADKMRMQVMSDAAQEVADAKASMEAQKTALEDKKNELITTQETLAQKRAEADQLLTQLLAKGEEYQKLIDESEEKQDQLLQEILNKEDEVEDAKFQEWLANQPTGGGGYGNTVNGITWILPMSYRRISSPFGPRVHPITGEIGKMHNGVDMTNDTGTPIYATRSGYVDYAGYEEGGAGNWIRINHGDGYKSVYMHMDYYIVSWGEYVTAGQQIGVCGSSGGSTGPHLHFGISYGGSYVNPANYIPI